MLLSILTLFYLLSALLLAIYACGDLILVVIYWRHRHHRQQTPAITRWPTVVVQLPVYNERYVVERLIDAVAAFDYPHSQLTIQVLDDSTDDTSDVIARRVTMLRKRGLDINHVQRSSRDGYKAGALAYGLTLVDSEFVVVLDADFIPAPDFLCHTIPHLVTNPHIGMVQTRWGHLNPYDNPLTLGQTLALDGHFVVEQTARNRAGWLINFNGSGGVWRAACIREAGGWRDTTLTEDLDLSYRAQLAGWEFLYLPDVVVPAELPPQMSAYKQQQARWAQGSTQTLVQMIVPLWRAPLTLMQRVMATMHLCQYMPHPLMIVLLLLTPPLMIAHELQNLPLSSLGLAGLGPPLVYIISQRTLYNDWPRRLLAFPVLLALGTGIAWNNTRAVLKGFVPGQRRTEFLRTPKFAHKGANNPYALRFNPAVWVEIFLAVYAFAGMGIALNINPSLAPYLGLYGFAFSAVVIWGVRDSWLLRK